MKTTITLEDPDIAAIFSDHGFKLTLANGQVIEIKADGKRPPAVNYQPDTISRRRRRSANRKGSSAERSAAKKETFFRVLKETGDIKIASKGARVTTSMGYRWRAAAGKAPMRRGRKPRPPSPMRTRDPDPNDPLRPFKCGAPDCHARYRTQAWLNNHHEREHSQSKT